MNRIRKGDHVIVIAGKDKGRQGQVLRIGAFDRIIVEAINMAKKHMKANPNQGVEGGIIEKEMPIHISNVMLLNPVSQKGERVGIKVLEDGSKVRYFKSNGEVVDI
jgi:large subunit ribosomal protein L24